MKKHKTRLNKPLIEGFYRSRKHGVVKVEVWKDVDGADLPIILHKDGLILDYFFPECYRYELRRIKDEEAILIDW